MDDGGTLIGSIDDNAKLSGRSVDLDHLLLNADVACVVLFEAGIVREDGGTAGGGNSGSGGSSEGTAAAGLLSKCTARRGDDRCLSTTAVCLGIIVVNRGDGLVAIAGKLFARLSSAGTARWLGQGADAIVAAGTACKFTFRV